MPLTWILRCLEFCNIHRGLKAFIKEVNMVTEYNFKSQLKAIWTSHCGVSRTKEMLWFRVQQPETARWVEAVILIREDREPLFWRKNKSDIQKHQVDGLQRITAKWTPQAAEVWEERRGTFMEAQASAQHLLLRDIRSDRCQFFVTQKVYWRTTEQDQIMKENDKSAVFVVSTRRSNLAG